MKKQKTTTIITNLRWRALFVVLLFLVIQMMPRALGQRGQRDIGQRTSDVQAPSHLDGGTWTGIDSLNTARFLHTATLLANGKVLVAGGLDNSFNATASAELYDPASGSWTATGSLNTARYEHTATLLPNGTVLVAGGVIAVAMLRRAQNYMTRQVTPGRSLVASTTNALSTLRLCYLTAWCWLQLELIAVSMLPTARNCMTRLAGLGQPPATSTPRAICIRRSCCPTGWCWLQQELIAVKVLLRAQNCTTR